MTPEQIRKASPKLDRLRRVEDIKQAVASRDDAELRVHDRLGATLFYHTVELPAPVVVTMLDRYREQLLEELRELGVEVPS
ncbi:hypothetical protein [Rhodoligotrophos defluvii]|uniref:hypothetical protein n=1 Tax=Rhodoligotrophos defluvii TaxID=2561934 RepID=UPI0010C97DCF|nr:hypothetical protein [Rhodoligotrophos defluvii]